MMDAVHNQVREGDWEYCRDILPKVSRTFALNIGQLEGDIFRTVLLGYLLFRIADTFEDTEHQDEDEKVKALHEYSEVFRGDKGLGQRLALYESLRFRWKEDSEEKNLVENGYRVLRCYFDIPENYRRIIDPLVAETAEGMAGFQERKRESPQKIFQLKDSNDLEDYCYCVAGVVGVMLTKIFCQREEIGRVRTQLERFQIQFGIALQLINILKDYRGDIARGWCYIPMAITERYQIDLNNIGELSHWQRKGVVQDMVHHIVPYLDSTLQYIKLLPLAEDSIRMFCVIPFTLGYMTLVEIVRMSGNKISREEVARLMEKSHSYVESNIVLEEDYLKARERYFTVQH